jgi:hypothetical protein
MLPGRREVAPSRHEKLLGVAVQVLGGHDGDTGVQQGALGHKSLGQNFVRLADLEFAHLHGSLHHRRVDDARLDRVQHFLQVVKGHDRQIPVGELRPLQHLG